MGERKRHNGSFLCFAAVVPEDEVEPRCGDVAPNKGSYPRRCWRRRILARIFRSSASVASLNRREKEEKESKLDSSVRKLADDDDERAASIFSSSSYSASSLSSSSSSSSSSTSSRLSLASLVALRESAVPRARQKMTPPPRKAPLAPARNRGGATGIFLLVASLSVMVFWGRLCSILCTSSWLFFVACQFSSGRPATTAKEVKDWTPSAELHRRRVLVEQAAEKKRVVLEGLLQRNQKLTNKY
ncbi:hypothetical protein C4D60_Mb10t19410 [Musa balbisiana]|uniref:Uncharacterized protein n=1 Tax=Musa balbisiana TaxID=52838 RepID=A0A4S8IZQ4_MUSBA|nr:hypothetical protein C4D60_Mb10t19410 [Musa balbisiana]